MFAAIAFFFFIIVLLMSTKKKNEHTEIPPSKTITNARSSNTSPSSCSYQKIAHKNNPLRAGNYLVGETIPPGEYILFSNEAQEAHYRIAPSSNKKVERSSLFFQGSCILTLFKGDCFKLEDGYAILSSEVVSIPRNKNSYMLKVGQHITAGTYQMIKINKSMFGIYYIFQNSRMEFDKAIDCDAFWEEVTITIENGQYVYVENAYITQ